MNLLDAVGSLFSAAPKELPEEPEEPEPEIIRNGVECCNHGHGKPSSTHYYESSNSYGDDKTWTITAVDKHECLNCQSKIRAEREIGTVGLDENENLVVLDE